MNESIGRDLRRLIGASGVVEARDHGRYERGYRYGSGLAASVVCPASTDEVRRVVRYCTSHGIVIIPQGANTGLVAASTPDSSGEQLVLSTERMSRIESIDALDRLATLQAGVRLSSLNASAAALGLFFPIDLSADPTIGGMIATNTGGAKQIRYGDVQSNLLGLEVVVADGDASLIQDLKGLRKDNSGLDLKQIFVGTGGTFGIITRALVEMHRVPQQTAVALVVPTSLDAIPLLLSVLEASAGEFLTAFEGISKNAMEAVLKHRPGLRNPFKSGPVPEYALLIELASTLSGDFGLDLSALLVDILSAQLGSPSSLVSDAVFGGPEIWSIRHAVSDAVKAEGPIIAFDVAVARSSFPRVREELCALVATQFPFLKVFDFGHCGDGGIHCNLAWTSDGPKEAVDTIRAIRDHIYDCVVNKFGGTFSAEHAVGPYNARYYKNFTPDVDRHFVASIKEHLDPFSVLSNVELG